jgi:hypothetical protein
LLFSFSFFHFLTEPLFLASSFVFYHRQAVTLAETAMVTMADRPEFEVAVEVPGVAEE